MNEWLALCGTHHPSCGRVLPAFRRRAALEDPAMDSPHPGFEPVRHVVEGARAYASLRGLPDPHDGSVDYGRVRTHRGLLTDVAREYDKLPEHDPKALPHFEAMRNEVNDQYHHMTNRMGIRMEVTDHDPYRDVHELAHDVRTNKRIKVLGTHVTGSHPLFSNEENDRFRAVHDLFGHLGAGRDFDRHGEEATYQAHARMFTPLARGALASETRGQNASLIVNSHFGPQRIAVMRRELWHPGLAHTSARDWDEFHRVQDSQLRDYERAGVGGSQEDRDRYYGLGEMRGGGQQRLLTPKDWITHSRDEQLSDQPPEFQANWAGHELGYAHARAGRIDHEELQMAADHFLAGYHEGLGAGFGEHRIARLVDDPQTFVRLGHVSGNNIDVLHCFAGDERFLTPEGPKSFAETVGTVQQVLTSPRGTHEGEWVDAPIRCYGEQEIWELTLTRNKQRKVVRTTAGHRWLVGRPGAYRTITTENLREGHRLAHLRTLIQNVEPSRDGIRQGVMFGDGSIARRDYGQGTYGFITLWGDKAKDLAEYFDEISVGTRAERENGLIGTRYSSGMAGWVKELPPLSAPLEFLRGWLMGYLAADGDVDRSGKVSLSSSVIENLEHVRNVATLLGLGTYGITTRVRAGYNAYDSAIYSVAFASGDLDTSWLLRQKHRDAFSAVKHRYDRFGWSVVSVKAAGEVEPVYCAEVPGTESFALEDNIWTKNCPFCGSGAIVARSDGSIECQFCESAFTVQVQPMYAAFPGTVNGQPYMWPGRPQGDNLPGAVGPDAMDPEALQGGVPGAEEAGDAASGFAEGAAPPPGQEVAEGDEEDGGDDGGNPFAKGSDDDSDDNDSDDDKKAKVKGKDAPPFGKKSSAYKPKAGDKRPKTPARLSPDENEPHEYKAGPKGYCAECGQSKGDRAHISKREAVFRTATGAVLSMEDYLRHLAINTADDRQAMAAKVKAARG